MAEAELDAGGNETGWVAEVVADALMDHDVNGVNLGDGEIDGAGKLQLPPGRGVMRRRALEIARSKR